LSVDSGSSHIVCKFWDGASQYYITVDSNKDLSLTGDELEVRDVGETLPTDDFGDITWVSVNTGALQDTFSYETASSLSLMGVTSQFGESLILNSPGLYSVFGIV